MLRITIQGLDDGIRDIELKCQAEKIEDIYPEFFGEILVVGTLRTVGNRHQFKGQAKCEAKLLCDLSSQEYTEEIVADLLINIHANTELFEMKNEDDEEYEDERVVHEYDKDYSIDRDVKEQLVVNLPMKRTAPEMRGKELKDIYPEYTETGMDEQVDEKVKENKNSPWSALKNLKLN